MAAALYLHDYGERETAVSCDACERLTRRVYAVSYSGVRADRSLCAACFAMAKARWGGFVEPRQREEKEG